MKSLVLCFVFSAFAALTCGETTPHMPHTHHTTREPTEHSSLSFFYDQASHYMIVQTMGTCYFMPLTKVEQNMVHNPDALRRLETQAIHMMTSAAHVPMKGGDHMHISHFVYTKLCAHSHLIKLVQVKK